MDTDRADYILQCGEQVPVVFGDLICRGRVYHMHTPRHAATAVAFTTAHQAQLCMHIGPPSATALPVIYADSSPDIVEGGHLAWRTFDQGHEITMSDVTQALADELGLVAVLTDPA